MKHFVTLAAALVAALTLTGGVRAQTGETAQKDIVEIAMSDPQFSTLVAAVKAAGLVDTLKGEGPFTVFAPTNAAFAKLPRGTVESLLKPENRDKLQAILTYHVLPKAVYAKSVVAAPNGAQAKTVQGAPITIYNKNGARVNNANLVKTDIAASNGVIHVIDRVILPPM